MTCAAAGVTAASTAVFLLWVPVPSQAAWAGATPASSDGTSRPSLAHAAVVAAVLGAAGGALFLPALRVSRCVHEARLAYMDAVASEGEAGESSAAAGAAARAGASRRLAVATAGAAVPLALVALWSPMLLGGGVVGVGEAGERARVWASAALLCCQLATVRPLLAQYLAAGRRRMVEALVRTSALAVKLNDGRPAQTPAQHPAAAGAADAAPAHGLSSRGVDLVMQALQPEALRPVLAAPLTLLHLASPPVALACTLALYVRLGGVDTGAAWALHAGLRRVGLDLPALMAARGPRRELTGELARLQSSLAELLPSPGELAPPAAARAHLGFALLVVALGLAVVQAGGGYYWARVQPLLSAAPPPDAKPAGGAAEAPAEAGAAGSAGQAAPASGGAMGKRGAQ